jgi:L-alanine-DL-glutamate epimerase-like enolase superfamily enzyme
MRITDIEPIHLSLPVIDAERGDGTQDTLLIRVHTDEGVTGIGEVDSSPLVAMAVVDAPASHSTAAGLRHLLVGEDPLQIDRLWDRMYRGTRYFGMSGPAIHAMSGVDIALWDILGQVSGRSVASMLGGVYRDRVKAYASAIMPETPEQAADMAAEYSDKGYLAMKFGWGPIGRDPRLDDALVAAIRGAVGPGIDIMIDAGQQWDLKGALRMADVCVEYGVHWLEEPLFSDDIAGYRELSRRCRIRIAAGEIESSYRGFETLLDDGGIDIVQPDLARCGGLTAGRRIARLVEDRHRALVPHAFKTGVLVAATAQFVAGIPNGHLMEHTVSTSPLARDLTASTAHYADGYVSVPVDRPGLGIELDDDIVRRYRR